MYYRLFFIFVKFLLYYLHDFNNNSPSTDQFYVTNSQPRIANPHFRGTFVGKEHLGATAYIGCVLFHNLTNLDRSKRNAPCSFSPDCLDLVLI